MLTHRYVINFGEMSEAEAGSWPDLMPIVEERVKPERIARTIRRSQERWWQFIRPRPELSAPQLHGSGRVLSYLPSRVTFLRFHCSSKRHGLQCRNCMYSHSVPLLPSASSIARPRNLGAILRFHAEGRPPLYPLRLLRDLPLPRNCETHPALEAAGKEYYEFRAALMVRNNEGLTKTYNRFHDPDERRPTS